MWGFCQPRRCDFDSEEDFESAMNDYEEAQYDYAEQYLENSRLTQWERII